MKARLLQIHWHERQPIYSLAFDGHGRLATAGGDNCIRIWRLDNVTRPSEQNVHDTGPSTGPTNPSYIATLRRHLKAVNAVQFHPTDPIIASGGDGGIVIIWKLVDNKADMKSGSLADAEPDEDDLEHWQPSSLCRISDNEDIYALQWSPSGRFLLIGLTDNSTSIWDMSIGKCIKTLKDHRHFVQGVTWDPLEECLATQSSDRSIRVYQYKLDKNNTLKTRCLQTIMKFPVLAKTNISNVDNGSQRTLHHKRLYHDETLVTFFRRLTFSPDGSLLLTPAGLNFRNIQSERDHCVYVYTRASLLSAHLEALPILALGPFERAAIVIRPHPKLFALTLTTEERRRLFSFDYRMIFAVGTQDAIFIYDTERSTPLALLRDLHCATLTDLAWTPDGLSLLVSSSDGYCSIICFDDNELGTPLSSEACQSIISRYRPKEAAMHNNASSEFSSIPSQVSDKLPSEVIMSITDVEMSEAATAAVESDDPSVHFSSI